MSCPNPEPCQVGGRERKPLYGSWPHLLSPSQILRDFNTPRTRAQVSAKPHFPLNWVSAVGRTVGRTATPPTLRVFFLDTAPLTGGCWEEGCLGDHGGLGVGNDLPSCFSWVLERKGWGHGEPGSPERPALAGLHATGKQAFAGWVPCLVHCSR